MFNIDLRNIQAIGEAHLSFDEHTIVEFTGNNSNGKSVISKVIGALTSGDIRHKEVRRSLIKDGKQEGLILMNYNERQLGLILKEEISESLVLYYPDIINDPENLISRELGDIEGSNALIREFGFRTYAKGDICLQLSPTFGAIPFVTTSGAINNDIVQDITTDKVADEFLEAFSKITFPTFKQRITTLKAKRDSVKAILDAMETYDWRVYEELQNKLQEIYDACQAFRTLSLEPIDIPYLDIIELSPIELRPIPIINVYDYIPSLSVNEKVLDDYLSVIDGICPTCGRPLVEHN